MKSKVIVTGLFASAVVIGSFYLHSNRKPTLNINSKDIDWSSRKAVLNFGGKKIDINYDDSSADANESHVPSWSYSDKYFLQIQNKFWKTYLYIIDKSTNKKEDGLIIDWNSKIMYNDVLAS